MQHIVGYNGDGTVENCYWPSRGESLAGLVLLVLAGTAQYEFKIGTQIYLFKCMLTTQKYDVF